MAFDSDVRRYVPIPSVVEQTVKIGPRIEVREILRIPPEMRLLVSSFNKVLLTRSGNESEGFDYGLPGSQVYTSLGEYDKALASGEDPITKSKLVGGQVLKEMGMRPGNISYLSTSVEDGIDWDIHFFTTDVSPANLDRATLRLAGDVQADWYSREEVLQIALSRGNMSDGRNAAELVRYLLRPPKQIGSKITEVVSNAGLNSLRLRRGNLSSLSEIQAIIFVGSSFSGKSTLVDSVRNALNEPDMSTKFVIPQRIITRPQRLNDNVIENAFYTLQELAEIEEYGEVGVHWVRHMEGIRTEQYAFPRVERGKIPIYSANNDILKGKNIRWLNTLLHKSLIIGVYAPEDIRRVRMQDRSPDLSSAEAAYRLGVRASSVYPDGHIMVKNFGRNEGRSQQDIVSLFKSISTLVD